MRTLLFLGLAIGAAFMANWFTIERDGDHTRIDINKDEIRHDANNVIEKGREILEKRERDGQANAQSNEGYWPAENNWPPTTPVQNMGYSDQGDEGNPPGYQPGNQGQTYNDPNYGGSNYGGQTYPNQTPANRQTPTYPASSRMPPPWQR